MEVCGRHPHLTPQLGKPTRRILFDGRQYGTDGRSKADGRNEALKTQLVTKQITSSALALLRLLHCTTQISFKKLSDLPHSVTQ
jgi:hypothetical protein